MATSTVSTATPTLNWEHALFLGNINRELETVEVKERILQLLLCFGVTVNESDLEVRYSKNSATYIAFVNLGRRDVQKYVYDSLSKDGTKLAEALVQDGRRLKVDFYRKITDESNNVVTTESNHNQNDTQGHTGISSELQGQGHAGVDSDVQGQSQDVSLEILGHSIQLESRPGPSSNLDHTPRPQMSHNNNDLSGREVRGHDLTQNNNTTQQHQVQVQGWMQGGSSQPNQESTTNAGIKHEKPGSSKRADVAIATQSTDDSDLMLSPTSKMRRRRKKKLNRVNQQQRFNSTDSDSDEFDRQSTGTYVLEHENSFLNNTYTLEDERSYLKTFNMTRPATSDATPCRQNSLASTSTSRPPSRLPRLKTRPSRCESVNTTRKTVPKNSEFIPKPPQPIQSLLPKRSGSPKRPPTRSKKSRGGNEESFSVGQKLGNETRHLEFKAGGGDYLKKILKDHVGKYVCAFLNSEGGSLMIGVADDGSVHGVHCDQLKEDRVRRDVDTVIRNFKPQVFPEMYTVNFIPVKNHRLGPLKVIKITVKEGLTGTLYENSRGEVYIRRDGSIQGPLKAHEIKEWCRMTFNKELDALKNREKELESELELQRQLESKLRMDLSKTHKNSKVCAIL